MFGLQWELEMIARLLLAVVLGAVVGIERESVNKSAGFRTHVLVAVGSCLIMIISISMPFIQYPFPNTTGERMADASRLAAQIVSGIGFLGAGAIMRSGMTVKGLTTAASLWAISGIGMAVGAGLYVVAIAGTTLVYISLTYFSKLETKLGISKQLITILIYCIPGSDLMCAVFSIFNNMNISIKNTKLLSEDDLEEEYVKIELIAKLPARTDLKQLENNLKAIDGIVKIEMG